MYSVVSEKQRRRAMRMRMNALYMVKPASGPPKWKQLPLRQRLHAIGDLSQLTRQQREVFNGNSDHFSNCPPPWDDEWLALHGTEEGEEGQTYDEWLALKAPREISSEDSDDENERHKLLLSMSFGSPASASQNQRSPKKKKRAPNRNKPPSVKELRDEYRKLLEPEPSMQQLWKREQAHRARRRRREDVMLEGKSSESDLRPWDCTICGEKGNSPASYACAACGGAPAEQATRDDSHDEHAYRNNSLNKLEKRIPAGNSKSHFYVIPLGSDFPENLADAVYACLQAYLHGRQVHLLPPMDMSHQKWDFEGLPLQELIWPHTEDPVALRAKRARAKKKRQAKERTAQKQASRRQANISRGTEVSSTSLVSAEEQPSQLSAAAVLDALHRRLKFHWHGADNAFVVIALTMRDLCDPTGVGLGIESLERNARTLDQIKLKKSENAGVLRRAMMEGDSDTQKVAQQKAKSFDHQIERITAERKFQQAKLRKRAQYVVEKTDLERRVSVLSFHRYHPSVGRSSLAKAPPRYEDEQVLIRRACKMAAHTVCEMFGMKHCVYYHCRMNGSATMEQQDLSPLHLCPVCLRKLLHAIGIHTTPRIIERYFNLQTLTGGIYRECFGKDATRWFKQRGATIEMAY